MKCRKCGIPGWTPGVVLVRENEKGKNGIFVCSPACGSLHKTMGDALDHAIEKSREKK